MSFAIQLFHLRDADEWSEEEKTSHITATLKKTKGQILITSTEARLLDTKQIN